MLKRALGVARTVPMGHTVAAFVARSNVRRIARQFIVGESAEKAAGKLESLWRGGTAFTCDLLGEKTVSSEQADRYAARIVEMLEVLQRASRQWPERPRLERDDVGALARVNEHKHQTDRSGYAICAPVGPRGPGPGKGAAAPDPEAGA